MAWSNKSKNAAKNDLDDSAAFTDLRSEPVQDEHIAHQNVTPRWSDSSRSKERDSSAVNHADTHRVGRRARSPWRRSLSAGANRRSKSRHTGSSRSSNSFGIQSDGSDPLDNIIINRLESGDTSAMSVFRSLMDKEKLLDAALRDGNPLCLKKVVQFLQSTLNPSLVFTLFESRPRAMQCLICLMEHGDDHESLKFLYEKMNRPKNMAMKMLTNANKCKNPREQLERLQGLVPVFSKYDCLSFELKMLKQQISLLARQIPIEENDSKFTEIESKFKLFPRPQIPSTSVAQTLYYLSLYHSNVPKGKLSCVKDFCKELQISEKRLEWTTLQTRARACDWDAIRALPKRKKVKLRKRKCEMGFDVFVQTLIGVKAPQKEIEYFIRLIEDRSEQHELCLKLKNYDLAVQLIEESKDGNHFRILEQHIQCGHVRGNEAMRLKFDLDSVRNNPKNSTWLK
eukprot:432426_1